MKLAEKRKKTKENERKGRGWKRRAAARILATVLSAVLLIELIPFSALGATDSEDSQEMADLLAAFDTSEPAEYGLDVTPYGYDAEEAFSMAAENELILLASYDMDDSSKSSCVFSWHGDLRRTEDENNISLMMGTACLYLPVSIVTSSVQNPFDEYGTYSSISTKKAYAYTRGVAFDPYGSGRKDHVAYIGLRYDSDNKNGEIVVWVLDVNTGNTSVAYEVGTADYMLNNNFEQFEAINLFAITAGRYTDSMNETFVFYVPAQNGNISLVEYKVTSERGAGTITLAKVKSTSLSDSNNYFHERASTTAGKTLISANSKDTMLAVSLASGDLTGDGIDELVVLSYWAAGYASGSSTLMSHWKYMTPQIVVATGGQGDSILGHSQARKLTHYSSTDSSYKYMTMACPSVTVGDVDGDGYNEVIAAGWTRALKVSSDKVTSQTFMKSVTAGIYRLKNGSLSAISEDIYAVSSDDDRPILNLVSQAVPSVFETIYKAFSMSMLMPQYKVECFAIDGASSKEYIFMNGTICSYNLDSGCIVQKFTPLAFRESDTSNLGFSVSMVFIDSTAVGVFESNEVGREQIIVSLGMMMSDGDDYAYYIGTIGGRNYDDTVKDGVTVSYGAHQKYYSTNFWNDSYSSGRVFYNKGANYYQRMNCLVVSADRGTDGTVARYVDKGYTYTSPNVITVLQAAPYFGELGSYGDSATAYSFTTEYTIGEQSSSSTSFSVGVSFESEGPGYKFAFGSGYTQSWSKSFESSYTESYTTTFTAKSRNQVVMQITPLIIYTYQIQKSDGTWDENRTMQITVPGSPSYALMSVDEYNAFVTAYNELTGVERYKTITDSTLLDNEGNPENYASEWLDSGTQLSKSSYTVNSTNGSITSEYESGSSKTESSTTSQGYYVDVMVGTGANYLVGSTYGGVESSVNGEDSYGTFTTTAEYTTVSGTVYGLGDLADEIPENILSQYGFQWSFGTWTVQIADGLKLPVYGYVVTNIKQAVAGPEWMKVYDTDNPDVISVYHDGVSGATNYIIYMKDYYGEWQVLSNVYKPGVGTAGYPITIPSDYRSDCLILAITAIVDGKETSMTGPVVYFRVDTRWSAYEIAVNNGFEGTEEEWLASLAGEDGEDGVGIVSMSIDADGHLIVILSTGEELDLGCIVGADGAAGAAGAAGVGISSVTINEDGELVVILTDNSEINLGAIAGQNGQTPYIGINGNWWIGDTDTGVAAQGPQGEKGEDGEDGLTPYIGENGNWWIGDVDTGVKAEGEDGADGQDGADGVGISSVVINEDGELIVTLTDGTVINLGNIIGSDGADGQDGEDGKDGQDGKDGEDGQDGKDGADGQDGTDGIGIAGIEINEDGELIVTLTDGTVINLGNIIGSDGKDGEDGEDGADGQDGKDGEDGVDGTDGIGIAGIEISEDGELIVTLTDGSVINLGNIIGADGADGKDGADGQDGKDGKDGADGQDGADGRDGVDGQDGADGKDGTNGIGIAGIEINEDGELIITLTDGSVLNLGNIIGADGADGQDGTDGADGQTPYIGENGNWWIGDTDTGVAATGASGADGQNGQDGADGADGQDGTNGTGEQSGTSVTGGTNGKDGADGKDGLTPYIGENGNWWIGDTDTGVAAAGEKGADGADGNGITDVQYNTAGELVFTLTDGSTISAGENPKNQNSAVQASAAVSEIDIEDVRTLATIAVVLSAMSMMWNVASLGVMIAKAKKK